MLVIDYMVILEKKSKKHGLTRSRLRLLLRLLSQCHHSFIRSRSLVTCGGILHLA